MASGQDALGAAGRRQIEHETEMAGDPKAARVCEAMPVTDQGIRARAELLPGLEDRRRLAEREEPGDVRKNGPRPHPHPLNQLHCRQAEHDNAGKFYVYEYLAGPLPLKYYRSRFEVGEHADGASVVWSADFGAGSAEEEAGLAEAIAGIYRAGLEGLAAAVSGR